MNWNGPMQKSEGAVIDLTREDSRITLEEFMNDHLTTADATAVILTGGKSSRMGRPKALLPFDGEPLIAHVVGSLKKLFTEAIVVAAPDQELPNLPVVLVRDEVAY